MSQLSLSLAAAVERGPCPTCKAQNVVVGTVCPLSLPCPNCHRGPGQQCVRPSEHPAPEMHVARWKAAEAIDRRNGLGPEVLAG